MNDWRKCPDCGFDYQSEECPNCAIDALRVELGNARVEIEQLRKKDAAWLKTATGFRVRLVEATDALKNIAAIDYTRAATTGACGLAVRIAKEALTTKDKTGFERNCANCGEEYGGIGVPLCPKCVSDKNCDHETITPEGCCWDCGKTMTEQGNG